MGGSVSRIPNVWWPCIGAVSSQIVVLEKKFMFISL